MASVRSYIIAGIVFLIASAPSSQNDHKSGSDHILISGNITGVVELQANNRANRGRNAFYGRGAAGRANPSSASTQDSVLIVITGSGSTNSNSAERLFLNQKDKQFVPDILAVQQNQTVRIQNSDPIYHNVFSLTSPHKFDVGRRPQGEHFDVDFQKPGVIDVFCDIHSNMYAIIYVLPDNAITWFKTATGENFDLSLEAGNYTLHVYAKGYKEYAQNISVRENESTDLGTIQLSR